MHLDEIEKQADAIDMAAKLYRASKSPAGQAIVRAATGASKAVGSASKSVSHFLYPEALPGQMDAIKAHYEAKLKHPVIYKDVANPMRGSVVHPEFHNAITEAMGLPQISPDKIVINAHPTRGAGVMAHELHHALSTPVSRVLHRADAIRGITPTLSSSAMGNRNPLEKLNPMVTALRKNKTISGMMDGMKHVNLAASVPHLAEEARANIGALSTIKKLYGTKEMLRNTPGLAYGMGTYAFNAAGPYMPFKGRVAGMGIASIPSIVDGIKGLKGGIKDGLVPHAEKIEAFKKSIIDRAYPEKEASMNPYQAYMQKKAIAVFNPGAAADDFLHSAVPKLISQHKGRDLRYAVGDAEKAHLARINEGSGPVFNQKDTAHAQNAIQDHAKNVSIYSHKDDRTGMAASNQALYGDKFGVNPLGHKAINTQSLAPHVVRKMTDLR